MGHRRETLSGDSAVWVAIDKEGDGGHYWKSYEIRALPPLHGDFTSGSACLTVIESV